MKTVGIIAEFNPFHNGHKYIIEQAKEKCGADRVIIAMSGAFTQRGTPAYMYKYDRVKSALSCGADLVLELPVSYCCATAEVFAFGGVSLLDALGVTDFLVFGSESGNSDILCEAAKALSAPDMSRSELMNRYLKEGLSFPAARAEAYPEYRDILSRPNNILAIEYIKAVLKLNSSLVPVALKRLGADYHDTDISAMASSSGIRSLFEGTDGASRTELSELFSVLSTAVPEPVSSIMNDGYGKTWPLCLNDFSQLLYYSLLRTDNETLAGYQDMNSDLANKMRRMLPEFTAAEDFAALIKSRELTYSRVSRALLHCMLAQKDLTRTPDGELIPCPYTRILGFKRDSSDLLHIIKQSTSIPVIAKAADAYSLLGPEAIAFYEQTVFADRIYDFILSQKYGTHLDDGCRISPIIL